MTNLSRSLRMCAVEALTALLKQVSTIKLNDVNAESTDSGQEIDILAHIDVLGHSHALACKVNDGGPHQVRKALEELDSDIACIAGSGSMTPVIIVPHLSPEVQALCWERKTGCLDLEGNGRLLVEEVFIFSRFLPHRVAHRPPTASARTAGTWSEDRSVLERFPPSPTALSPGASRTVACACPR